MTRAYAGDFHIHGNYSGATSDRMVFDTIAEQAVRKGLDFVGSGDILHPNWIESAKEDLERLDEGIYEHPRNDVKFVFTVEVEDVHRVHHLLFVPSLGKAEELRDKFSPHSMDINIDGRPKLELNPPRIVEMASESGCLVGPSHAFTPWTSIYKEFDSLDECYGDQLVNVDFLELGLSADTYMADRIEELSGLTFLSNSDAHSPWPNKLGREFNRFSLSALSTSEVFDVVREGESLDLNVGLDPRLGKYHLSACAQCHERFTIEEARSAGWKCEVCGGSIKKGVSDRVEELADFESPRGPSSRPDYLRTSPLSEIISLAKDRANPRSKDVQRVWSTLVERFDDEVSVLVDVPIREIEKVSNPSVALMIRSFRRGELDISPGGGGEYGELEVPPKVIKARRADNQKTLSEFGG